MKTIFNDRYRYLPSPNSAPGLKPRVILFHYTGGGSARGTATWLRNPEIERSYHFIVGRQGDIYQLVPLDRMAWHAGRSEGVDPESGEVHSWLNSWSIGIALANYGLLSADKDGHYWYEAGGTSYLYDGPEPVWGSLQFDTGHVVSGPWEPYPEAQIEATEELWDVLVGAGYPPHTLGHEEVGMPFGRKIDPGPLFPWTRFGRIHGRRTYAMLSG